VTYREQIGVYWFPRNTQTSGLNDMLPSVEAMAAMCTSGTIIQGTQYKALDLKTKIHLQGKRRPSKTSVKKTISKAKSFNTRGAH